MPTRPDQVEVPFYADDLLPDLQRTLAILADLETRYERARAIIWSGGQARGRSRTVSWPTSSSATGPSGNR
jgi:hypothetical protein